MKEPTASSDDGSVGIGGDNTGSVFNVKAEKGSTVQLTLEHHQASQLPSLLAKVIVLFSQQSLSEYGLGVRRKLPPEVSEKLSFNNLPQNHKIFTDYYRHIGLLEMSYLGVEQQNPDARYLVRRKARIAYEDRLLLACTEASVIGEQKTAFAIKNSIMLIDGVIAQLLHDYTCSSTLKVEQEYAHLAISLIVADAVVECEVLEKPHAITA